MNKWIVACCVVLVVLVASRSHLFADAQSDLDRAKSDFETLKSKTSDLKDTGNHYLDESRALREMDEEQLEKLIEQICRLDIKREGDDPHKVAKEITDKISERVKQE